MTGNLTRDPEIKILPSGKVVCGFTVADSYKPNRDAEETTTFIDVVLWGTLAENFANTVKRGQRVIVEGRINQRSWETKDGEKRTKLELIGESAGPDLRWQAGSVTKAASNERPARDAFDDEPF